MDKIELSEERSWQKAMLPVMTKMLVALTIFFFLASAAQLVYLHWTILNSPDLDPQHILGPLSNNTVSGKSNPHNAVVEGLFYLECKALALRYHQANVLLMSRIWTKYLSFVTGMIMCVVGASFILGKLTSSETVLKGQTQVLSFALASSSPGIILVSLGTLLIGVSFFAYRQIQVMDAAIYVPGQKVSSEKAPSQDFVKKVVDNLLKSMIVDTNDVKTKPSQNGNSTKPSPDSVKKVVDNVLKNMIVDENSREDKTVGPDKPK